MAHGRSLVWSLLVLLSGGLPTAARAQLTFLGSQYWDEDSMGIKDSSEPNDSFGNSIATGDFDCDGFDDVAVGVPFEDVADILTGTTENSAGAVHVLFGGPQGVATGGRDLIITALSAPLDQRTQAGAHFGAAVAAYRSGTACGPRLAIGAPGFNASAVALDSGAVYLFRYSQAQDDFVLVRALEQSMFVDPAADEAGDEFGYAIAAIDFNDRQDCAGDNPMPGLAIGAPGEAINLGAHDEGAVYIIRGRFCPAPTPYEWENELCGGGEDVPCLVLSQEVPGFGADSETNDRFAEALSGRVHNRLIIGVPGEDSGTGVIQVVYNYSSNFDVRRIDQDALDHGASESGDGFGSALVEGDFNHDGRLDLAIGIPGEDTNSNTIASAGAVAVIYSESGSPVFLPVTGDDLFTQDDFPPAGGEAFDHFGSSLAVGDFDGNGVDDLAIGVPHEDVGSATNAGAINVLYGVNATGLSTTGQQTFTQNTSQVPGVSEDCDVFGTALAAGDFDGANGADLAIGVPGEDGTCNGFNLPQNNPGGVNVLYSSINGSLSQISGSFSPSPVAENAGSSTLTVTKTGSSIISASIHIQTSSDTALSGVDFTPLDLDAAWGVGDSSDKTVALTVIDNPNDEPNRSLDLHLLAPSAGATIVGGSTIPLTINDDDVFTQFADDFDTSATASWSSHTNTVNTMNFSPGTRYAGSHALRIGITDTSNAFVTDDKPFASTYHARFYLRLHTLTMSSGDTFLLFSGTASDGSGVFQLHAVAGSGGARFIRPVHFLVTGSSVVGSDVAFPDGMHAVEISWTMSTQLTPPNGTFRVKIDGTTVSTTTGIANLGMRVDHVRLGAVAGLDAGTTGSLGIDEFASKVSSNLDQISAFGDVQKTDPLWNFIHSMWNDAVTRGCEVNQTNDPLLFCPLNPLSRAQLAALLVRAEDGPAAAPPASCSSAPFSDVVTSDLFCRFINALKVRGISPSGCGGGRYCPSNPVSRGALAVLVIRTLGTSTSTCTTKPFNDVEISDARCPFIQAFKTAGISAGCGSGNYCPDEPVRRQEAAILLERAFAYRLPLFP